MSHLHGGNIYDYKNIIDFSANINPLGILPEIVAAAKDSLLQIMNYPDIHCSELRSTLALSIGIDKNYIICGNGAADLIFQIVLAKRPRKALLVAPGFAEYEQALKIVNTEIAFYYLEEKYGFEVQDSFLDCLEQGLDMVILCNPNNPTGKTIDPDLLEKIIEVTTRREILLVMDECFNDFLEEPEKHSLKSKISSNSNIFILKAFTKMYAMAGLRLGYGLCSNVELLEKMCDLRQPWSVSIPAQAAGIAALKNKEFPEITRKYIKNEREYLFYNIQKLGITYLESEANFIFFKGIPELKEKLVKEGILIRDCCNYRGLEQGYYRVAIKTREENEQLVKALNKIIIY